MDGFDQTQALDGPQLIDISDTDDTDDHGSSNKKQVGCLKVLSQRGFPETDYPVYMGENVIGRSIDECQIHVPIKVLSKRHAVIEVEKDVHMVYDSASHNKSYKGNLPLKPMVRYEITDGEKLKFGDVKCEYSKCCLISVDENDSLSETATASIFVGPSTSGQNLSGSKVFAEPIERDTKSFDGSAKGFELKSDSDDDSFIIPSSQSKDRILASVNVPETPADPLKTAARPSEKEPIVVLSDSDTDIELDKSSAGDRLNSKAETMKVDVDSDADFEEAADDLNILEAPTQPYPSDAECFTNKAKHLNSAAAADCSKDDEEIDWENMQTQPYRVHISDDEMMYLETEDYPVQGKELAPVEECSTPDENFALADTLPVLSEVEIANEPPSAVDKAKECESEISASQSCDPEFREVQNEAEAVLHSSALVLSPQTPVVHTTKLGMSKEASESVAKDAVVPSNVESITKRKAPTNEELPLSGRTEKAENQVESPPKARGRKKSPKTTVETSAMIPQADSGSNSRKTRRGKQKPDEKVVLENDDAAKSPAKKEKLGTVKDKGFAPLPGPVALNPSLPSSPKTYSRRERSKDRTDLEHHSMSAVDEAKFLEGTGAVGSHEKQDLEDQEIVVEGSPEPDPVPFLPEMKEKRKRSKPVAIDVINGSDSEKDSDTPLATYHNRRKKSALLETSDESFELTESSDEIRLNAAVKIPSTSNTPFRRVGRRLDAELADCDRLDGTKSCSVQQRSSKRKGKTVKKGSVDTEDESFVPLMLNLRRKKALVLPPVASVDEKEVTEVQKRSTRGASKRSSTVTSLEEEKPKTPRGLSKKTAVVENSPIALRTTRKRGNENGAQIEENVPTGKVKKISKRMVAGVAIEPETSDDDFEEVATVTEDAFAHRTSMLRSKKTAPTRTPSKRRQTSEVQEEDTTSLLEGKTEVTPPSTRSRKLAYLKKSPASESSTQRVTPSPAQTPCTRGRKSRGTEVQKEAEATTPRSRSAARNETPKRTVASVLAEDGLPKVMFTGLSDAQLEKTVKKLGGSLVDSVLECTHLVTDKIRRTCKLLCIVARGQSVVSFDWLHKCREAKHFVDSLPFLIRDKAAEDQFGFSLSKSLRRASKKQFLNGYSVHVTRSVKPDPEQMKPIIECSGGEFLSKMPRRTSDASTILVVSCPEDLKLCSSATKVAIPVVGSEFILTGVLRQEVDITSNILHDGRASSPVSNASPRAYGVARRKRSSVQDDLNEHELKGINKKRRKSTEKEVSIDVEVASSRNTKRGKAKTVKDNSPGHSSSQKAALSRKKRK